jgi:hypothetical protein
MGIFSIFNNKEITPTEVVVKNKEISGFQALAINHDYSKPIQESYKTSRGYLFGTNGLFPQELNYLYNQSPLHSAIINFKQLLTTGGGLEVDNSTLDTNQKIVLNQLLLQFNSFENELGMDYFMHSRLALRITWNVDNTKILKVERLAPDTTRIFDVDDTMKPKSYIYCWDWNLPSKYVPKIYPAFDQQNKKDKVQILMWQGASPTKKLYVEPSYISCLNWITLDAEMSMYHKSNIQNSLNPSMLIQFFEKPGSPEEKTKVLDGINNSFAGANKTGRAMVTFSDGKELAPLVQQMEPNKLDATFLQLTDTIQRQICYSHNIDPQLLGLKTPGSLGNSGEMEYSYNVFNQSIIQPAQRQIEKILNGLLAINGLGVKVKFKDVEVVLPSDTTKMTEQEEEAVEMNAEEQIVVNEHLKGMTGRQTQGLLRIVRQYQKGQLTKEQAKMMIQGAFGLTDDQVKLFIK